MTLKTKQNSGIISDKDIWHRWAAALLRDPLIAIQNKEISVTGIFSVGGRLHYNAVVPLPLGLPILAERLAQGYYRQSAALIHDAQLIADNANEFNGAGSDVAHMAAGNLKPRILA